MGRSFDSPSTDSLQVELELLKRRYQRERDARLKAEELLEKKSLELFGVNSELKKLNKVLADTDINRKRVLDILINSCSFQDNCF